MDAQFAELVDEQNAFRVVGKMLVKLLLVDCFALPLSLIPSKSSSEIHGKTCALNRVASAK
jgi:hypothetical protein